MSYKDWVTRNAPVERVTPRSVPGRSGIMLPEGTESRPMITNTQFRDAVIADNARLAELNMQRVAPTRTGMSILEDEIGIRRTLPNFRDMQLMDMSDSFNNMANASIAYDLAAQPFQSNTIRPNISRPNVWPSLSMPPPNPGDVVRASDATTVSTVGVDQNNMSINEIQRAIERLTSDSQLLVQRDARAIDDMRRQTEAFQTTPPARAYRLHDSFVRYSHATPRLHGENAFKIAAHIALGVALHSEYEHYNHHDVADFPVSFAPWIHRLATVAANDYNFYFVGDLYREVAEKFGSWYLGTIMFRVGERPTIEECADFVFEAMIDYLAVSNPRGVVADRLRCVS